MGVHSSGDSTFNEHNQYTVKQEEEKLCEDIPVSSPDDFEKKYWNWLDGEYSQNLRQIRLAVRKLNRDCESTYPQLAGYTPHGPEHMSRVENILHRLIPGRSIEKLKMRERFYLLASAWLHDVGMLRGINGDSERDLSAYPDEAVRRNHHSRAEKFIVNHFSRLDVAPQDAHALGLLALYHRRSEPLEECPEEFPVSNTTVRLRLLAAYLRLADSLDIDQSRSPASEYAICISYNISVNSKLHWIKSRLVSGIGIEPESQKVVVFFKHPHDSALREELKRMRLSEKEIPVLQNNLKNLEKLIIEDLEEELGSVKNTLIRGSISYFLDIEERYTKMIIDDQIFPELLLLANNFDMISHPSATRLMYMVLVTVQRILQRHPFSEDKADGIDDCRGNGLTDGNCKSEDDEAVATSMHCNQKYKSLKSELQEFFDELECEVLQNRRCHLGLSRLVTKLKDSLLKDSIFTFTGLVWREKKNIDIERKGIRNIASRYFGRFLGSLSTPQIEAVDLKNGKEKPVPGSQADDGIIDESRITDLIRENIRKKLNPKITDSANGQSAKVIAKRRINIMVYGYSELVIKALCGFRDQMVKRTLRVINEEEELVRIHKLNIEAEASDIFRIFVCEGQPKTITAPNDALDYHDGTRYASALARRGFTKIIILPDLVAGSLLQRSSLEQLPQIHFVMFGANGLEFQSQDAKSRKGTNRVVRDLFRHSSGHLAIAALTAHLRAEDAKNNPKLVLVIGSSKCAPYDSAAERFVTHDPRAIGVVQEKYGYRFWSVFAGESVRTDPFLVRDETVRKELRDHGIFLYNPREDAVPLSMVDDVILEFAHYSNLKDEENLKTFREDLAKKCKETQG